jgi:hypothetical protein
MFKRILFFSTPPKKYQKLIIGFMVGTAPKKKGNFSNIKATIKVKIEEGCSDLK